MTRLLVSVRSAEEAEAALAGGADFIDVKEPRRGALGCADPAVLCAVAEAVGERAPLSAALGELAVPRPPEIYRALAGYQFAKLGLADAAKLGDWPAQWRRAANELPEGVRPVAVAYADWQRCSAPSPWAILHHARAHDCAALLIDTFHKDGSTIFDAIECDELAPILAAARQADLLTLIAGSLRTCDLPNAVAVAPDVLAVRGAVCRGARTAAVCAELVAEFRAELARNSHCPHAIHRAPV